VIISENVKKGFWNDGVLGIKKGWDLPNLPVCIPKQELANE